MLEVYTTNASATASGIIPLDTVTIKKGNSAILNGNAINLMQNGVYMVSVDGVITSASTGTASVQLYRDGTAVPQAVSSATIGTASDLMPFSFETLVRVCKCPCSEDAPSLTLVNTGIASTVDCNVVVTKVC